MEPRSSSAISKALLSEWEDARKNPKEVFGFGNYGDHWPTLNRLTGGIKNKVWTVLASRPKVGKSMMVSGWIPAIAMQARAVNRIVRVVTLETTMKAYQRRTAAIMAGIPNPMNIRRGMLSQQEADDYVGALRFLADLPIEYLSNETTLSEREAMMFGNSSITMKDIKAFLKQDDTFWWVVDHMGLVNDINAKDPTASMLIAANQFAIFAHQYTGGMCVTHLTRASVGGGMPSLEHLSGSDGVGKNADEAFLIWRPWKEARSLKPEEAEMVKDGEPGLLVVVSREESGGIIPVYWNKRTASFTEYELPDGSFNIPLPK